MPGIGTIINCLAIIVGGVLGLVGKSLLKESMQNLLMEASGICVVFIGIAGTLQEMLVVNADGISTQGTMMAIVSFAIGSLLGQLIDISGKLESFGTWLKVKTKSEGDGGFVNAFVTASLTVCIGAMAVVGSIQDGIMSDPSILVAKALLDLIIIMIMTASMGKGSIFSAIPVGIFQGSVTLLSQFIKPILSEQAISNLSLTGSMLIFCVGLNLIRDRKINVANMLPTIVIAVIWAFL